MRPRFRPLLIAGVVWCVAMAITLVLWSHERQSAENQLKTRLDFNLREASSRIEQHMASYELLVRGVNGYFAGSVRPSRDDFQAYVASLVLGADFSGIEALGLATLVPSATLAAHTELMRQSGLAWYQVYPPGERERYAPIVQLAPTSATNLQLLGYDPLGDVQQRAAMVRAADSGSPSISQTMPAGEPRRALGQADCIMYLPLYARGLVPETPQARRQALVGWTFVALRISDLMASVYGSQRGEIDISLHENIDRQPDSLLYTSDPSGANTAGMAARRVVTEYLAMNGVTWVLTVRAGPDFAKTDGLAQAKVILLAGTLLAALLALVCWQMMTTKDYALSLAREMTDELRKSESLARHLAQHDPLTGIPNRALFSDRLSQAISQAKRDKTRLALLYIDLDNFKPVNDTHGHALGDAVLQEVGARLCRVIRESDTAGRIGGDEFVVLLPLIGSNDSVAVVGQKIIESLREPIVVADKILAVYASIGIATYPEHGDDEVSLFKSADQAMYQAKARQRNCLQWAS